VIRIRLYALPEDTAAAVAALAEVFDVLEDCGDRAARGRTRLRFRYLTVRIRPDHPATRSPNQP
jgi:hypothetical protein